MIDNKILIDLGEKKYLRYYPAIILITHLHQDHAFFVSQKENIGMDGPVYAPEVSSILKEAKVLSQPVRMDNYKITPVPVTHSLKVKSQGYLIEAANKRIFYSGDIVEIDRQHWKYLHRLNVVITEGSFFRKGGVVRKNDNGQKYGHAGIPDLVELFKRFTSRIIFTHFGAWYIKDIETGKQKMKSLEQKNLKIEMAFDGREFSV